MDMLAHGGLEHTTKTEAVTHSSASTIITPLLVSLAALAILSISVYALKKFSVIEVPAKDKED